MSKTSVAEPKLGKSELTLVKKYCSRASDEDLSLLASSLPQSMMGDRAAACEILQRDKEMDKWLALASGVNDWFVKIDSVGELAIMEIQSRSKKSEK